MSSSDIAQKPPQDIGELNDVQPLLFTLPKIHVLVAIFHASFHPTQGHVIDWSLKASDGAHET